MAEENRTAPSPTEPNNQSETGDKAKTTPTGSNVPEYNSSWFKSTKEAWINHIKGAQMSEVVWFPVNELQTERAPFLKPGELFEFERLPLNEVTKRIYEGDFDFDKYLAHQEESVSMSIGCAFFLGIIVGGLIGYQDGSKAAQTMASEYQGQNLSSKKRAKLYNEGAHIIKSHVSKMAVTTGVKFSLLAGSFGIVHYQLAKYRRKSDPLNFAAGGFALGTVGGSIQGGMKGMLRGALSMGAIGLVVGGLIELVKFGAATDANIFHNKTRSVKNVTEKE